MRSEAIHDDRIWKGNAWGAASLTGLAKALLGNSTAARPFRNAGVQTIRNQVINLTGRTSALPRGAEHAVRVRYSHLAALPL